MVTNALTVDLEDWYHPELIRKSSGSPSGQARLPECVPTILDLLSRYRVKITFFILGECAETFPDLIRRIDAEGHEIGCHGMSHRMLGDLGEEGFRRDLKDFKALMKTILGDRRIKGFRAPTFSLNRETRWSLAALRDFGYEYDSSIFPKKLFWNPLYGVDGAPRHPYRVSFEDPAREDPRSPLWEFPAAVARFAGFDLPVSGGFYFRVLPASVFRWGLKRMNGRGPFFVYLHPWECDEKTPRMPLPFLARNATYFGIRSTLKKLEGLLKRFSFSRMDDVLSRMGAG